MADWKSFTLGASAAAALGGAAHLGHKAGKKKGFQRGVETASMLHQAAQPEEKVAGQAFWAGFAKKASWGQAINKGLQSFGNWAKPMLTNATPMAKHYGGQALGLAKNHPVATAGAALGAGYMMGRRGRPGQMPTPPAPPA